MTVTMARKFRYGDRVRLWQADAAVWTVVGDDTDSPHTLDPEPAYKLQGCVRADGYSLTRYCYESTLVRVGPSPTGVAPLAI